MAIEVRISGTTYKAADDFLIKQQAGAVSMSTVSVLKGANPIPQPLQSAQIRIDGTPVFYGLISTVQDPRRSTGYEPARYTIEIQSIETVLNFRMAKRNWYNKRVDEIVTDIFNDYLAEEGLTLGGISTTTVQIGAYRKTHAKISEILDELAEKIDGASYYIAPDKKFYFLVRDEFPAIEAPDRVTNMSRSRSYGDLRTVQVVKGASAGILATWTNTALKAAIAALSGTSGKIEAMRDDSTIRNPTAAATEAEDTATRHAENEQTIRCEVEGIAGTDLYTLWDIAPSRVVGGETVPTKWPAEYEGEYVVIERTISGSGGKIQTSLTLRNRNYFARYGYAVRTIAAGNALNNERLVEEYSQDRLTPSKKISTLREFQAAGDAVTALDAQADALGITTEKATFDAAFQALGTYLNGGDPWDGIATPAWLAEEAMTFTEEIDGTEYDAAWLNFNLKKTALQEKIAFATSASNNAYADAAAEAAETAAKAHADGIVTAEEQRAIADAQAKADAARDAAISAAAADATAKATAAQTAAEGYAQAQAAAAQTAAEAHADGIVSAEEARAIADATAKANAARDAAISAAAADATAKANAAQLLSEGYAAAAATAAETAAKAYADGEVSAEEARAIADATAKADAARQAAIAAALEKGPGSNMFPLADFPKGWEGFSWGGSGMAYASAGNNLNADWALGGNTDANNTQGLNATFISHGARTTGSYGQFESSPIYGVAAGKRYLVSVYSGAHRCQVGIYLIFLDANGGFLGYAGDTADSTNNDAASGGRLITGYKRIFAYNTAPVGTAYARVMIRKWDTKEGYSDSYGFFCRAQVEEVSDYTTQPGPWTPYATGTYVGKLEAYAQAQAALAQTTAQAYADGIVTAEEARAIADATAKADAARDAAIAAAAADSTTKSAAAQAAAEAYALAQANLAQTAAQSYADGAVDAEEARAIADAAAKADAAQAAAIAAAQADATTKANAAQAAAETYAAAQATLARTTAEAYADGIVSAEEARAIADATAKANAARDAAISAAAADATAKANAAQAASEAYTRSATKYLTALTTQGDFQGQLGLFAGRIYRWTGAVWDPQDAIIPTDTPALYLSFDDVPDIPDDPAGTTYKSNWATSVDGWLPNYGTSSVNYQDGALVFSGNGVSSDIAVYKPSVQLNGKIYIIKIRYDPDLEGINYYTGTSTYGLTLHRVGEYYIAVAACTTNGYNNATLYFLYTHASIAATKTITMLDAYIGTGAYLTPAIDNSGNGKHGNISGGAIPCAGVSGKGVRFDGTKAISLGAVAGNMGNGSFTFSVWVKGAPSGFVLCKRSGGYSNGFGLRGGSVYFISSSPDNELYADITASWPSGWNNIVGVYDRTNHVIRSYLNGVHYQTTSIAGYTNPIDPWNPLTIGGTTWGTSEMTTGDIDEVCIIPRALSDSEIRGLYLAKSLPKLYTLSDYQLDQMASDSVITPQEKGQVSTEWTRINGNGSTTGSYWMAKAEAAALSVSYTAAEAARNALYAYLYTSPGVLASRDVPTTITPATWRDLWRAYDEAEFALVNAISAKRAANAEAAATAAAALDATAKADAAKVYADGLSSALQTQLDRAIVYYTQVGDPSADWTTQSSRNEHIGDLWRISSLATWRQWSGSAWTDITDPVAQAAATAAQSTANVKSTLWATLAIAQGNAVAGDLFLDASLLYRCTVAGASITLENSTRLTPKRYADVADSTARAALTGMILGDRVYQTDTLQWYVYTTSWVTDGPALASVPATYAPRFLGRYNASHPGTVHPGDWWVVYDTDDSPIQRGVYYSNAGTSTRISAVSGEAGHTTDQTLLSKLSSAMPEVAWAEKNGFGTASDYGISMYFESFGAVTAFILSLFAKEVTISPDGYIKSANYAEDVDEIPTSGYILDALNQVIKSYGSVFRNIVIKTAQIEDASFSGIIQSDALDTQQEILSTWTASGTFYGYDIKEYFGLVAEQEYSCLATTFYGKTPSKIKYYKTGIKNLTQAYAVKVTFTDASTLDLYEGVSYSSSTYSGTIQIGQYALALQNCYAGSYLLTSKTTPSAARTTSATKVIEFTFARKGSVNIKMAAGASVTPGSTSNFSSYTLNARIYKDGAAYGTSRSVTVPAYTWDTETGTGSGGAASGSWTEDVTGITAGTKVQIYIWVSAVRTGALQSASMDIRIAQEGFSDL